ncbi:hypothetical protein [Paraburkholderia terricola]|jgi:hypothetical protein|uniref:Uncharacterized protein n=2 Tax=Burkholderiaceae TaxID=119060 RepID=A0A1M6SMZ0_9BURK|nr:MULTISPECIES: hypothetical protein [Paraburkholderia]SDO65006.1 hypothetical protein SAMN05192547_102259 [Paraburkholderia sediminicola]SHK46073.1 hypothetical protein SAMN05192548_102336 [Paraburkholderia terricola]
MQHSRIYAAPSLFLLSESALASRNLVWQSEDDLLLCSPSTACPMARRTNVRVLSERFPPRAWSDSKPGMPFQIAMHDIAGVNLSIGHSQTRRVIEFGCFEQFIGVKRLRIATGALNAYFIFHCNIRLAIEAHADIFGCVKAGVKISTSSARFPSAFFASQRVLAHGPKSNSVAIAVVDEALNRRVRRLKQGKPCHRGSSWD